VQRRPVTHRIWRRRNDPVVRMATAILAVVAVVGTGATVRRTPQAGTPFATQIASLSEPEGYFDTDNLISNESSYLEVLPELDSRGVRGGAYVGVGPDQNFSYIAHVRPSIAFIIDIRRDNLLLHLLFKALFAEARTRLEYLALLFGRPVPGDIDSWRVVPVARLVEHINRASAEAKSVDALRAKLDVIVKGFGVPLSSDDMSKIDRFHRQFIERGMALQFHSAGREPQSYYPTYQDLLLERDGQGRQGNYLASEADFQFVKSLQARDRIVPVVGDLSGPSAILRIARSLADKGETLSTFYASNVEFYLDRQGGYQRFINNLGRLPHTSRSVIIRSVFNRGFGGSMSRVQAVEELLAESAVAR
jgi:hypothetical protein